MGKEKEALNLIESSFQDFDKAVVACSWGKDSLVVLHLVKRVADKLDRDFDVLWNNTGVHYPSVYKLKEKLEENWDLNIIETKYNKSFWEIVEEYGWPGVNSSDRSDKANSACCYNIKKKPTKEAIKTNNWDLYFDGLTAYESDRRYMNMNQYGLSHYHKSFKLQKVHPIGWWTVDNVWDYIEKNNIPYPDIYNAEVGDYTKRGYSEQKQGHRFDRAIRNGCWCCTLALKYAPEKMEQLRKYYPKLWKTLMKKGLAKEIAKIKLNGQGSLFNGFFNEEKEDHWLENLPCFFDKI
ncbi:MAG: phosphoadenosine phosphosulfate reductase family protein [Bacillota bacterium]